MSEVIRDIVERFSLEKVFWELDLEICYLWLMEFERFIGVFDGLVVDKCLKVLYVVVLVGFF